MITRESSYSELASIKAKAEERAFYWLELADAKVREFAQSDDFMALKYATACAEWATESYRQAEFAHSLMLTYWNS